MRKCIFLLPAICLIIFGCQESAKKSKPASDSAYKIPKTMVGIWEAAASPEDEALSPKWAFKIEPNGVIPKIVHPIAGQMDVSKGGYEIPGPDPNTFAAFIIGPCQTSFDDANGIFKVHIVLDGFTMKLPQGEISGKSEDIFKGSVSEDGKIWYADWYGYTTVEGGAPPDVNAINANPQKLVFYKIDPTKPADPNQHKGHEHK